MGCIWVLSKIFNKILEIKSFADRGGTLVVQSVIKKTPGFPRGSHVTGKKYAPTLYVLLTDNLHRPSLCSS